MSKIILTILLLTATTFAANLWTELYSESMAGSDIEVMDAYYGTLSLGISFKKFDLYGTTLRYGTKNGFSYVGPGVRKTITIKGLMISPFAEVLYSNTGSCARMGLFSALNFKIGE